MQDDDTSNPGMLSVLDGEALWKRKAGSASVRRLSRRAAASMEGVAARYPAFDTAVGAGRPRAAHRHLRPTAQGATAHYESQDLLALTAFVARRCRGMPIACRRSRRRAIHREQGKPPTGAGEGGSICCASAMTQLGTMLAGAPSPGASHQLSDLPAGMAEPARCNGGFAIPWSGSAPSLTTWRIGVRGSTPS